MSSTGLAARSTSPLVARHRDQRQVDGGRPADPGRRGSRSRAPLAGNTDFGSPLSAHAGRDAPLIVCEASSYQLEGCPSLLPEAAVLTNLEGEHLHRHGTMVAYVGCKRRLFVRGDSAVATAVICTDDSWSARVAGAVRERGGRVVTYGRGAGVDYRLLRSRWTASAGWLEFDCPDGRIEPRRASRGSTMRSTPSARSPPAGHSGCRWTPC